MKIAEDRKAKNYLFIMLFCGMLLMVLPAKQTADDNEPQVTEEIFSLEKEEQRLEQLLSSIQGVGRCMVLLSVSEGSELILAEDEEGTVVISNGKTESPITVLKKYPCYQGAVIVCGGVDDANTRFDILSAVMSYTGLGIDKITICPIEE